MWPGAGLLSSKVHELLRPQRHSLFEPDWKKYKQFLEPLAGKDSSYQCLDLHPYKQNTWTGLVEKHLSKHGVPTSQALDHVKDTTLLVLANCPSTGRGDVAASGWWADVAENFARAPGYTAYQNVQILISAPTFDLRYMVPKLSSRRRRFSILYESVGSHLFQVAGTPDFDDSYFTIATLDQINDNANHVSAKAEALNVATPPGREPPGFDLLPPAPPRGGVPPPHVPRVKTEWHRSMLEIMGAGDKPRVDSTAIYRQGKAHKKLLKENQRVYLDQQGLQVGLEFDRLNQRLSRDAANPALDSRALQPLADELKAKRAAWSEVQRDEKAIDRRDGASFLIDNQRTSQVHGNYDNPILPWYRRPFEPLTIQPDEFYPHDSSRGFVFFDMNASSPYIHRLNGLTPAVRTEALEIAESLMYLLNSRSWISLSELCETLFPRQPINDLVEKIPSLAAFAYKFMKPNFDELPKTLHSGPETRQGEQGPDPAECFQENLNYDLSDVRLRILSSRTILEIALLYQQRSDKLSAVQLARALGCAVTASKAGRAGIFT